MKQNNPVLLLSGTPASGKDTTTSLLVKLNPRFRHFKKHRGSNQPKTDGTYIHVTPDEFAVMSDHGEFLQHHYRYDRGYGVSLKELNQHWAKGEIPIIHVGKYENILPLRTQEGNVRSVLLMVSLAETERRLKQRHVDDAEEVERRITAYREERAELAVLINSGRALEFDLIVDNSTNNPEEIAQLIARLYADRAS
jgi:guanylate kinase